jgi:hypothetical protein
VEVQIVFKGQMAEGHEQWDNNEGNNWQVRLGQALIASADQPDGPQHLRSGAEAALLLVQHHGRCISVRSARPEDKPHALVAALPHPAQPITDAMVALQVVAELAPQEGVVHPAPVSGAAVSGLVLLLQALQLKGLLSTQQEQTLRLLAWQHDGRLMRAWDAVSIRLA